MERLELSISQLYSKYSFLQPACDERATMRSERRWGAKWRVEGC